MKLKICGMKYNTEEVAGLEPDYLGFIFWEPSARFFNGSIPEFESRSKRVGVFVDAPLESVILQLYEHELHALQLHGKEDPPYCERLRELVDKKQEKSIEIIKAFPVHDGFDFDILEPFVPFCDYFLFDTRSDLPGGSGKKFNWQLLRNYHLSTPYFLSGGIGLDDTENIKEFSVQPAAKYCSVIDVNSRFEIEPGLKDIDTLNQFMEEIGFSTSKKRKL